ncbi:glycoside hydrolase family 9 protein [Clostridium hydrogenum]|uniref:glycoside hydrolase family 9 protein n=1 Tax=Clostridium hydrogenum TaxID=2855764 RepID=UPI001F3C58EC|nr:glycoside hydrolase family 9 protein [Clostridium hydrogenum]
MNRAIACVAAIFMAGAQIFPVGSRQVKAATNFNYTDAFAKSILFYEANWCGADAGNNRIKWRGPCHEEDGSDVGIDLTGGFHDAGDHVKFGLPQAYSAATLGWSYYEFKDAFAAKGQDKYMLNILKHFTDYFLKCYPNNTTFYYQCGDGTTDHSYWGPPELQKTSRPTLFVATPSKPASDVCGETAAALALMSINYRTEDSIYADKCLTAAENLYNFAKTYRGLSQSGGFYTSSSYLDDLSWAGIWLYEATNKNNYMTDVQGFINEKGISGNNTYANHWTQCWDDVFSGVFLKLAQITNDPKYKTIVEENLDYWMEDVKTTQGGLKYLTDWGTLRYTAAECMLAEVYYKTTNVDKYINFAKSQIDYILGNNPENMSYEVGFGSNYPKYPHHRAASGRLEGEPGNESKTEPEKHLLYGALVGGPDDNDKYVDNIEDYQHSEVALDYNAGFVGALAGMTNYYGAKQLPQATPGIEANTPENYVEATAMRENNQACTIQASIHNDSILPPKYEKGLTFRYFVDLSEYYAKGLTAKDITVSANYSPNVGKISNLIPWDEKNHIYYVEASWPDMEIYGKQEIQFTLGCYNSNDWDSSNDFSHKGLTSSAAIITKNIPVYQNGVKIYGDEPLSGTKIVGDINKDGSVDVQDLMLLRDCLINGNSQVDTALYDVNGDGKIDILDLTKLRDLII